MASRADVEAGRAFVRLFLKNDMSKQLVLALRSAQKRLTSFGQSATRMGRQVALAGLAAVAPFALATRVFAGFDDEMRTVGAVTQAVGKDFDRLRDQAKQLGSATSFTARQVAGGMVSLGRGGFDPTQILEATDDVLALARATGTELPDAARIAAGAMNGFGMTADQMGRITDVQAFTVNNSAQTLTDYGESLKMVAKIASEAGEDVEDVSAMIAMLADNTIVGTMAGTSIARAYKNLSSTKVDAMLKRLNVDAEDANKNMRPLASILTDIGKATAGMGSRERLGIFESLFGRGGIAAITLSAPTAKLGDFRAELDNVAGTAKATAAKMDSGIGGSFRKLMSAVEGVGIEIGEALAPALSKLATWMTNAAQSAIKWIKENKAMVIAAAAAAAAVIGIGIALTGLGVAAHVAAFAMGGLAAIVATVTSPLRLLGSVVRGASKVLSGSLTVALWGLKTALAAAAIGFRVMSSAVTIGINVVTGLVSVITGIATSLATLAALGPVGLLLALGAAVVAVAGGFAVLNRGAKAAAKGIDNMGRGVASMGRAVKNAAGSMAELTRTVSTNLWDSVVAAAGAAKQALGTLMTDAKAGFNHLVADIGGSWETLQGLLATGNFAEAWKVTLSLARLEWVRFKHWLLKLWDSISPTVNDVVVNAADMIGNVLARIKIAWSDIWDGLHSGLRSFLKVLDAAMASARKYIAMTEEFFTLGFADTNVDSGPPLELLVPGPRSAEQKATEDAATREQGSAVAETIKRTLVTPEKTPAEQEAATAARKQELADTIKAHAVVFREATAAKAAAEAEAKSKAAEAAGAAGGGGAGGGGGGAGGAGAPAVAPQGVALTATYSAAAARISGFQPGAQSPAEQQNEAMTGMAINTGKLVELTKIGQGLLERFLAGWKIE